MTQLTANKKTLILTGFNQDVYSLLPDITNKKSDELLILNSFGSVISQPYGCTIRNIILAIYKENIEEIYIVGEKSKKELTITEDELLHKMEESGIAKETLETIEYIKVAGNDVLNWLVGSDHAEGMIKKNIELIQKHPLITKNIPVYGVLADTETREFHSVS